LPCRIASPSDSQRSTEFTDQHQGNAGGKHRSGEGISMSQHHDGQGDAMPCTCPACTSAFVMRQPHRMTGALPRGPVEPLPDFAEVIENIAAGNACTVWCGDACTCGRGPERGDLDPVDVAGMRAVEGRGR
jgi:hypothetical protein